MSTRQQSELILNKDGSIFHLHLLPHQVTTNIILVGDPSRVKMIAEYFDTIEHQVENREFITYTGTYKNKPITVTSTGIGTDNIDIVINELDALFNINLETGQEKETKTKLNFIRIGTSGSLQENLNVDSVVIAEYVFGLDNLMFYYKNLSSINETKILTDFQQKNKYIIPNVVPYIIKVSEALLKKFEANVFKGITLTAPGFYAPQGRKLRLDIACENQNKIIADYKYKNLSITNFEMETSALYGLSKLLGHEAITLCVIIANRMKKEFSKDINIPMRKLILKVLHEL